MDYDIYHDESKELGYWHGILLVPRTNRSQLLNGLSRIRTETGYAHPLQLKGLNNRGTSRFRCTRAWIQLGAVSLIQKLKNDNDELIFFGTRAYDKKKGLHVKYEDSIRLENPVNARFILFRERDGHNSMDPQNEFMDYGAKVETTLRMGLKGGMHLLFSPEDMAIIKTIHFDGYEHHSGRHIDKDRVIGRMDGLRGYCSFDDDLSVHDGSSDHRIENAQDYDDCQLLQLTDLLVGSFRTILGESRHDAQKEVAFPIKGLADKWKGGHARMRNSRWYKGFCISECHLKDGEWEFTEVAKEACPQQKLFSM